MLAPTNRFMLGDALRPPAGHTLDIAVGTTFTLDLNALLLATVSLAVFDRMDTEDGRPDPIALLESVRRHADNITVFAQAGAMSGPRDHPPILAYLEDAVVPVRPPKPGHLFHPKVWALRFVDANGAPRYRLVIMSRNLTFDASWDTVVALDGTPTARPRKTDAKVGHFIEHLPSLALHPLDARRAADINQLAADLREVHWEPPPGVRWLRFHPLGPSFDTPTIKGNRLLAMSPFLSLDMVETLGQVAGPNVLVSRAAALDGVGADAVAGFAETYVVDTGTDIPAPPMPDSHESDHTHASPDSAQSFTVRPAIAATGVGRATAGPRAAVAPMVPGALRATETGTTTVSPAATAAPATSVPPATAA